MRLTSSLLYLRVCVRSFQHIRQTINGPNYVAPRLNSLFCSTDVCIPSQHPHHTRKCQRVPQPTCRLPGGSGPHPAAAASVPQHPRVPANLSWAVDTRCLSGLSVPSVRSPREDGATTECLQSWDVKGSRGPLSSQRSGRGKAPACPWQKVSTHREHESLSRGLDLPPGLGPKRALGCPSPIRGGQGSAPEHLPGGNYWGNYKGHVQFHHPGVAESVWGRHADAQGCLCEARHTHHGPGLLLGSTLGRRTHTPSPDLPWSRKEHGVLLREQQGLDHWVQALVPEPLIWPA